MATAYVALGANLGDRLASLRTAVARLDELGRIEAVSPVYETDPIGYADQPPFLNAVVRLRTDLTPDALLTSLLQVETDHGRVRTFPNAPRPLDLDLLFYDDLILNTPDLTLPHPRLYERAFVLVPLNDLAPDLVHPSLGKSARVLLAPFGATPDVRPFGLIDPSPDHGDATRS